MNLNREHSSYKDETLFFEPRTSSLLNNRKCSIFVSQMFIIFLFKYIHVGSCLKDLLQEIRWCNWNLIWRFGLSVMIFFNSLKTNCIGYEWVGPTRWDNLYEASHAPCGPSGELRLWWAKKLGWNHHRQVVIVHASTVEDEPHPCV